jgi:hypothetical protein
VYVEGRLYLAHDIEVQSMTRCVCVLGTSSLAGAGGADLLASKLFLSSTSGEYDSYCGKDEFREAKPQTTSSASS